MKKSVLATKRANSKRMNGYGGYEMERVAGIEPAYSAWKAAALPLSYTRGGEFDPCRMVEEVGFEPT